MNQRLPPFSALRGFEATARHLNFKNAAEELCLTQSAVSHQVRLLENFLGKPLFHRAAKGVSLTGAGQTYFEEIAPLFSRLAQATRDLMDDNDHPVLSLRCSHGFAKRWLLPRLPDAREKMPDIEVSLSMSPTSMEDVDTVDIRINCGFEVPPGKGVEIFIVNRGAPVCSPDFLTVHGPVNTVADLLRLPMLREHGSAGWGKWLALFAGGEAPTGPVAMMNDHYATLDAAEAGLGVTLTGLTLIRRELVEGRLVQVLDSMTDAAVTYTLTSPLGWQGDSRIVRFREWLYRQNEALPEHRAPIELVSTAGR